METKDNKIYISDVVTVKEFAEKANLPVTAVISELMKNGVLATINQTIDFETASIIGEYLNLEVVPEVSKEEEIAPRKQVSEDAKNLEFRPPVVTIMGHVDHGKTSLLDKIRESKVAESESGGITQHITAYQVTLNEAKHKELKGRKITFIDTPGHAAFSKMRQHGATITDIVVLIIAANDGVMPQTEEVIHEAQTNNIPLIVAINKVDLPDADIMKTKQQLSEFDLVPEEWGGKTVMVELSAKTGEGINDLLEMILLQADLLEFKANPKDKAVGVVIESRVEKGVGNIALVLIENGTLHVGEPIAIGSVYGKVRILTDFNGKNIVAAEPSTPVRIAGLKSLPSFGDRLVAFDNIKEAVLSAEMSGSVKSKIHIASAKRISKEGEEERTTIPFNIIIKSDVSGSLEAIKKLLLEIESKEIEIKIVSEGVGSISESDITLAKATGASVYGFRVQSLMAAKKIAEKEGIRLEFFDVIYRLIEDVKREAAKLLPPDIIEEEKGRLKVLAIFRDDKKVFVGGGRIESGKLAVNDTMKVIQDSNEKYRDKISSLRQGKNEVKECDAGIECGFSISPGAKVSIGDTVISFKRTEQERTIG